MRVLNEPIAVVQLKNRSRHQDLAAWSKRNISQLLSAMPIYEFKMILRTIDCYCRGSGDTKSDFVHHAGRGPASWQPLPVPHISYFPNNADSLPRR